MQLYKLIVTYSAIGNTRIVFVIEYLCILLQRSSKIIEISKKKENKSCM